MAPKKNVKVAKKTTSSFYVVCDTPVKDNILDAEALTQYFVERIKVAGKTGNFGDKLSVEKEGSKICVTAEAPFPKRYLKYLTKRFLKKHQLRDYLHVIATSKQVYELKYFNMNNEDKEDN